MVIIPLKKLPAGSVFHFLDDHTEFVIIEQKEKAPGYTKKFSRVVKYCCRENSYTMVHHNQVFHGGHTLHYNNDRYVSLVGNNPNFKKYR
jgi:dihydroorotase-like cyclic amidohydrolase